MAAVQEGHLAIRLDPYFVPRMLCEDGESSNVQAEFEGFGESSWEGLAMLRRRCRRGRCIPRHVPNDRSWCLDIEVARLARERRT